jgi:CDP-L-myo-inositol myo-inositolphosphotransferase
MKALIIAAGRGKRIRPLSGDRPKPLVKLLGLSLIERIILSAREAGIKEFVVVIGYQGHKIREALGTGSNYNVKIEYIENPDWKRGNAISVLKAREHLKENFILLMGDHIFEHTIVKELKGLKLEGADVALVVDKTPAEYLDMEDATKVTVEGDRVVNLGKTLSEFDAIDCGIFLCTPKVFDKLEEAIKEGRETLTEGMQTIASKGRLLAVDSKGRFWMDIDTAEALKKAEEILCSKLIKPTDGFISRKLNRPLSLRITRYLVNTSLRPNTISFISFGFCLISAFFLSIGSYISTLIGGLFVQLSSVIDGCDGEVARLKYQASDYGAWLDSVLDRYADAIIILGIVLGLWKYQEGLETWLVGYTALIGSFVNSYTATKFDALVKRRKKAHWRFGRDTRLFLIMLGAIVNQLYYLLFTLAIITNLVSFRRLYVMKSISH